MRCFLKGLLDMQQILYLRKSIANFLKPSALSAARSRFNSLLDTNYSPIRINVLREDNICRLWSMAKSHSKYYTIILVCELYTPSSELFKELNWQTFPERVTYQKAILMYRIINNISPDYLKKLWLIYF